MRLVRYCGWRPIRHMFPCHAACLGSYPSALCSLCPSHSTSRRGYCCSNSNCCVHCRYASAFVPTPAHDPGAALPPNNTRNPPATFLRPSPRQMPWTLSLRFFHTPVGKFLKTAPPGHARRPASGREGMVHHSMATARALPQITAFRPILSSLTTPPLSWGWSTLTSLTLRTPSSTSQAEDTQKLNRDLQTPSCATQQRKQQTSLGEAARQQD